MDDLYTNDLTKEKQPQSEWRNKFNRLVAATVNMVCMPLFSCKVSRGIATQRGEYRC